MTSAESSVADEGRLPEEIFNDALDRPLDERERFLNAACGGDDALRQEVEELLKVAEGDPGLSQITSHFQLPDRLGRYEILELCGAGGMGTVFKARDPDLARIVALKRLAMPGLPFCDIASLAEEARQRMQREAQCLANLDHPNIAKVYSLEYEDGTPFIVMEFVGGASLSEILASNRVSPLERLRFSRDIASGIEAAHAAGIIHRDLKPANVMVGKDGIVKILDFGIAKVLEAPEQDENSGRSTCQISVTVSTRAGTPGYMSPEQASGRAVDHRTDIWAFGRLLCDAFALGDPEQIQSTVGTKEQGVPPQRTAPSTGARMRASGLTWLMRPRIEKLARWCQQPLPQDRPKSMSEVRSALEQIGRIQRLMQFLRRWGWVAPIIVLALATSLLLRGIFSSGPVPISARAVGSEVIVDYAEGGRRVLKSPTNLGQDIDGATIVRAGDKSDQRIIVGWTGSASSVRSRVLAWQADGKHIRTVESTRDWPYMPPPEDPLDLFSRKRFAKILPPSELRPTLVALEYARYYPSVIRVFVSTPTSLRETFRLYHEGQANDVVYSPGFEPGTSLLWITGRTRNGGPLREAANGVVQNTHFLACFPGTVEGTAVFPPWIQPDSSFVVEHRSGVRPAQPLLYFVLRGIRAKEGQIIWNYSDSLKVDELFAPRPGTIGVLLSSTVRLDLRSEGPREIAIEASVSSEVSETLGRRADVLGVPADSLVRRFLADSVVSLASSRDGWIVTGDFKDIRDQLPRAWE